MTDILSDAKMIRDLEWQRFRAIRDSDVDTLDELFADTLFYVHSNATSDTKASFLEKIRTQELRCSDALHHPDDHVVLNGDTAIATGTVTGTVYVKGVPVSLCTRALAVWSRHNGRWQLLAYQSTPIPAAAAAAIPAVSAATSGG